MARTVFKPIDDQRHLVKAISSCGIRQTDIATWVGLRSPKTPRKHFREELHRGRVEADVEVGKTFYTMAISGRYPSATIYYVHRQAARRAQLAPGTNPVVAPDFLITPKKEAA